MSINFPAPDSPCSQETVLLDTEDRNTKIGEVHSWDDMEATFTYGRTADSQIEGGVKVNGERWEGSGFVAIRNQKENAVSVDVSGRFGKQQESRMKYALERFDTDCGFLWSHSGDPKFRATEWLGGRIDGKDVSGGDGRHDEFVGSRACYGKNSGDVKISGKGFVYQGAACIWGFCARATSGYGEFLKTEWTTGSSKDYYFLYGAELHPPAAPVVYASSGSGSLPPDCTPGG